MIRIETSTEILPILNSGLYGTILGSYYEECLEENSQNFIKYLVDKVKEKIEDMINDCKTLNGIEVRDFNFHSPREYNFVNDTVEFTLEIPDITELKAIAWVEEIKNNIQTNEEIKELFGSHSGFISFAPADSWNDLYNAIKHISTKDKFDRAMQIYLYFQFKEYCDLEEYQNDFEEEIIENGNKNGWFCREEFD